MWLSPRARFCTARRSLLAGKFPCGGISRNWWDGCKGEQEIFSEGRRNQKQDMGERHLEKVLELQGIRSLLVTAERQPYASGFSRFASSVSKTWAPKPECRSKWQPSYSCFTGSLWGSACGFWSLSWLSSIPTTTLIGGKRVCWAVAGQHWGNVAFTMAPGKLLLVSSTRVCERRYCKEMKACAVCEQPRPGMSHWMQFLIVWGI